MYKTLLKRKLAYLIQSSDASIINSPAISKSYRRFDEQKEKEIIVWIRQLWGMDKQQINDEVKSKFNVSDDDAERLYYKAYPDGISSQEEEIIDHFEKILPQQQPQQLVDDAIVIVLQDDPSLYNNNKNLDQETYVLFTDFLKQMMLDRKLI